MEDTTRYYKDAPKMVCELMQDTFGSQFRYYLGSPAMLGADAYPCLIVQPSASSNSTANAPTGHDEIEETINIFILYIDSQGAHSGPSENTTMRNIYQLVQGRDPQTKQYMKRTVLATLRRENDLGGMVFDSDISIDYDANRDESGKIVLQAVITLKTYERVAIPDRI